MTAISWQVGEVALGSGSVAPVHGDDGRDEARGTPVVQMLDHGKFDVAHDATPQPDIAAYFHRKTTTAMVTATPTLIHQRIQSKRISTSIRSIMVKAVSGSGSVVPVQDDEGTEQDGRCHHAVGAQFDQIEQVE